MLRFTLAILAILPAAFVVAGCSSPNNGDIAAPAPTTSEQNADPAIEQALGQLSSEDRALAESQSICPVTEEPLGSMGTPIKLTVDGQDVFICCASCEEELRANPDQYLSKLGDQ